MPDASPIPLCYEEGMSRVLTVLLCSAIACSCSRSGAVSETARLEKQFQETLTHATLTGHFSAGGGQGGEDKYVIESVSKVGGDLWLIRARIQYGKRDVSVPVPLKVLWAGDTPVLTLTDLGIPGLGTYTARVLIYRDHYAGTWSAKDHGGQMWGTITR
jgi:hypothetical protein